MGLGLTVADGVTVGEGFTVVGGLAGGALVVGVWVGLVLDSDGLGVGLWS